MAVISVAAFEVRNSVSTGFALPNIDRPEPLEIGEQASLVAGRGTAGFFKQPKDMAQVRDRVSPGNTFKMWGDLFWFEHVHIIPKSFTLGNILSDLEREFEVYNAYRKTNKTIVTITETGVDGLTITQPSASPLVLRYSNGFVIPVTISLNGPVIANATISYAFDGGEVLSVTFTGTRVIMMTLEPQVPIREVVEWRTDILQSSSGREQRVAARDAPRQVWRYDFIKEDQVMQWLENAVFGWQANLWGVPVWTDYTELTADASAAAITLDVTSTENRDFRYDPDDGTELALVFRDYRTFEAVEVSSFTSTQIALRTATVSTWSAGDLVIPVRLSRIKGLPRFNNFLKYYKQLSASFESVSLASAPSASGFNLYQSLPVLEDGLIAPSRRYSVTYDRDVDEFNSDVGKPTRKSVRDFPKVTMSGLQLSANDRSEYVRLKNFFDSRRGRQKAFWINSGREDFTLRAETLAPTVTLRANEVQYGNLVGFATTRRDIEILYVDGSSDRRRITDVTVTEGVGEDLTLDSNVTQDLNDSNVERISYLHKVRLGNDELEFIHNWYDGLATVEIRLVEIFE